MKTTATLVLVFLASLIQAQDIDYNTKRGFVANGYDVVAYFNQEAKQGDKAFTTTFDGAKYKFASQKNLELFMANPEQYVPQYGGYCAYAIATKSKKVGIDPKTFEIRDGKLYLFYNAWGNNTLESWLEESPETLKVTADSNWEGIKYKG